MLLFMMEFLASPTPTKYQVIGNIHLIYWQKEEDIAAEVDISGTTAYRKKI